MDLPEADKKLMQKNSGEIYQCIWNWFENWEREREREREKVMKSVRVFFLIYREQIFYMLCWLHQRLKERAL